MSGTIGYLVLLSFIFGITYLITRGLLKAIYHYRIAGPETPVTERGLRKYDHLPSHQAAVQAWIGDGINPQWHRARKYDAARYMPQLATALHYLTTATQLDRDVATYKRQVLEVWLGRRAGDIHEHRRARMHITRGMPLLARALDRMTWETIKQGRSLGLNDQGGTPGE